MVERGIPIDGVGMETHTEIQYNGEGLADSMKQIADLGLEIHITEFDASCTNPWKPS